MSPCASPKPISAPPKAPHVSINPTELAISDHNVCQGLWQECVLSPLKFNIFAAVIIVVLQRSAADPLTISDLMYLDGAPKGEEDRPREKEPLEMVRRAVLGMLYEGDTGVVSTSPRDLPRMMTVIVVVACQEFGLTVSEKKTEAMYLWSDPSTASHTLQIEAAGQRRKQKPSLCILVVLSARAWTSAPRLSVALAPLGRSVKI